MSNRRDALPRDRWDEAPYFDNRRVVGTLPVVGNWRAVICDVNIAESIENALASIEVMPVLGWAVTEKLADGLLMEEVEPVIPLEIDYRRVYQGAEVSGTLSRLVCLLAPDQQLADVSHAINDYIKRDVKIQPLPRP